MRYQGRLISRSYLNGWNCWCRRLLSVVFVFVPGKDNEKYVEAGKDGEEDRMKDADAIYLVKHEERGNANGDEVCPVSVARKLYREEDIEEAVDEYIERDEGLCTRGNILEGMHEESDNTVVWVLKKLSLGNESNPPVHRFLAHEQDKKTARGFPDTIDGLERDAEFE